MKMITFFYVFFYKKCNAEKKLAANITLYLHTIIWFLIGMLLGGLLFLLSGRNLDMTTCLLTGGAATALLVGYIGGLCKLVNVME